MKDGSVAALGKDATIDEILKATNWEERLAVARVERARVLAERAAKKAEAEAALKQPLKLEPSEMILATVAHETPVARPRAAGADLAADQRRTATRTRARLRTSAAICVAAAIAIWPRPLGYLVDVLAVTLAPGPAVTTEAAALTAPPAIPAAVAPRPATGALPARGASVAPLVLASSAAVVAQPSVGLAAPVQRSEIAVWVDVQKSQEMPEFVELLQAVLPLPLVADKAGLSRPAALPGATSEPLDGVVRRVAMVSNVPRPVAVIPGAIPQSLALPDGGEVSAIAIPAALSTEPSMGRLTAVLPLSAPDLLGSPDLAEAVIPPSPALETVGFARVSVFLPARAPYRCDGPVGRFDPFGGVRIGAFQSCALHDRGRSGALFPPGGSGGGLCHRGDVRCPSARLYRVPAQPAGRFSGGLAGRHRATGTGCAATGGARARTASRGAGRYRETGTPTRGSAGC